MRQVGVIKPPKTIMVGIVLQFCLYSVFGAETGPRYTACVPVCLPTHTTRPHTNAYKLQKPFGLTTTPTKSTGNGVQCQRASGQFKSPASADPNTQQSPTNKYGLGGNHWCDRNEHEQRKGKWSGGKETKDHVSFVVGSRPLLTPPSLALFITELSRKSSRICFRTTIASSLCLERQHFGPRPKTYLFLCGLSIR